MFNFENVRSLSICPCLCFCLCFCLSLSFSLSLSLTHSVCLLSVCLSATLSTNENYVTVGGYLVFLEGCWSDRRVTTTSWWFGTIFLDCQRATSSLSLTKRITQLHTVFIAWRCDPPSTEHIGSCISMRRRLANGARVSWLSPRVYWFSNS